MRLACIDIGTNTTRLLVADCQDGRLVEVHQERAFTRIGKELSGAGMIGEAKMREVVRVVGEQLASARAHGAREVRGVATAAIRSAVNGDALITAIDGAWGLAVETLSSEREARLAFAGAAGTLDHAPVGELGVVDVGGGSSELVLGTAPNQVRWWTSLAVGSGDLADRCLHSDPPSDIELAAARAQIAAAFGSLRVPRPTQAVAVGGNATSLRKLAGPLLDPAVFARCLGLLGRERASEIARRFTIDPERARLLPAGLLILEAASELFGVALLVGCGGIREGVLLGAVKA
jgi:exopolyphosphatase / guanosine-5'-triphosphate,3'-diphosphate pyrophosphatase